MIIPLREQQCDLVQTRRWTPASLHKIGETPQMRVLISADPAAVCGRSGFAWTVCLSVDDWSVDIREQVPEPLKQLDLGKLVGLPIDEARKAVEGAGGQVRSAVPHGPVTADFRPDRVTLVVEDGLVIGARGLS